MSEPIADGQTAVELLSDPHHGRANARMLAARIKDGSLVDKDKLKSLVDAAMSLAASAASKRDQRAFCALMKVIQGQQKIEIAEANTGQPSFHLHAHAEADTRRHRLAEFLTRVGLSETAQRYLAER